MKLFLPLVPLALSAEYSPNSPAADPNGFAASITKNPLRNVFENIFNEDEVWDSAEINIAREPTL